MPVYYAAAFTPDDIALSGVGYGEVDLVARTSALGEMVETYSTFASFRDLPRKHGSYNELRRGGTLALDPLECRLPVDTDYTPDRPLQWVEATRWPDGARQLGPARVRREQRR